VRYALSRRPRRSVVTALSAPVTGYPLRRAGNEGSERVSAPRQAARPSPHASAARVAAHSSSSACTNACGRLPRSWRWRTSNSSESRPGGPHGSGLALVAIALVSPIRTLAEERLFYVHMTQHLLLGDLAPLLVVLGLTGPLLRPLLAWAPVRRLRALANPLVALPLWTVNLCFWHLPALYEAALRHELVHALQHVSFFTAGALMWAAVIEPLPGPRWFGNGAKAIYVLAVRTVGALLGSVFIWAQSPFYPAYERGERLAGISPSTDQAIGGALMFVEGSVVTLVAFAWLFLRWTREAELRQSLEDGGHDPEAAARAARYGRSALAVEARRGPPPAPPPRPEAGRAPLAPPPAAHGRCDA
jgi:putative membrane protein